MKAFLALCVAIPLVFASELRIPVVEDNIIFRNGEPIKASQMGDLLSALNGYSLEISDPWKGLKRYDPLHHPKLYLIADFGVGDNIKLSMNSNLKFPLILDEQLDEEFNEFRERSIQRMRETEGKMVAVYASEDFDEHLNDLHPSADKRLEEAKKLPAAANFDPQVAADRAFMIEYYTLWSLYMLTAKTVIKGHISEAYWVNLDSLRALNKTYGATHEKTVRAAELFSQLIGTITGGLEPKKGAIFMVISETEDPAIKTVRAKRDAETKSEVKAEGDAEWNLGDQFSDDYHIVFSIVAFVMLAIILGVLATSVGLWFMDPGRDSIIYRMTQTRMKMD